MWPSLVEVLDIGIKYAVELLLMQRQHVIQALTTHTSQKSLTDRIGPRSVVRRFKHLNSAGCGHTSERGTKLAITIVNEVLRSGAVGGGLPQLLGSPHIERRSW